MATFPEPILGDNAVSYRAQVAAADMPDGRWEGWIEFIPVRGGHPLRTPRETTQPNRTDMVYWATGLSPVYLEGALERALNKRTVHAPASRPLPAFDRPAPSEARPRTVPAADAVLDPFEVYENGEAMLRGRLEALEGWHLVNILVAFNLSEHPASALEHLPESSLIDLIIAAVRERSPRG